MIGDGNFDKLLQSFSDQFEKLLDGSYVYRKSQKGPPIPVTGEERESFIDDYLKRLRIAHWSFMLLVAVVLGLMVWLTVSAGGELPIEALVVSVIALVAVFVAYTIWARVAPARKLENRTPIGRERSTDEMRALRLRKMSYGQLAGAVAAGVVLVVSRASKEDLFSGWHRLWLAFAAALILIAAIQAFRKWRFEQERSDEPR